MTSRTPFAGLQVLEISAGIPASYCGKMLVDAGADVVKLEPAAGDPMRRWSASGTLPAAGESGALFGYLNAGKRSVRSADTTDPGVPTLFAAAQVVITDGSDGWTPARIAERVGLDSRAVVVSITPFGLEGPYVDQGLEVNEFILQAMCGSTGGRGWPGEMPLQAGGRIGEWVAGAYAAVAAIAGMRRGAGVGLELIDVSMLESMVITMGGLTAVAASVLGEARPLAGRSVEMPSITATADGLVGFCTVTAQQFQDFLVMIDRADLLEDADLASFAGRAARREEFLAIVDGWASTRTTAEIVDFASAMRIPVAPIGSPNTVTEIDHFRERGVFVKNASGQLQPRAPYRSAAFETVPPGEVPTLGGDDGMVEWLPPAETTASAASARPKARPLEDLRVVDLTAFWAGPIATQLLGALGADVIKVEGIRRPDGMRFASGRPPTTDQWWETGSVFLCSNNDKRDLTLELSLPEARDVLLELIATADLVIENFSPRVMGNLGLDEATIHTANPSVVVIRMPAFGLDGPWRDRVGFAQTMEQASGMAWMTGLRDGPPQIPRGACDPIAGLHATFAAMAGLRVREQTGTGMQIESTMVEAALNVAAEALLDGASQAEEPRRDGNRGPGASPQGVYRCAGDDEWVALAVLDDERWPALAALIDPAGVLGDGLAGESDRRAHADAIDTVIGAWLAGLEVHDAVDRLRAAGVSAARVLPPAELLVDPQLVARGFWERVDHPVAGSFLTSSQPFRFASVPEGWVRHPAPLFGQHNVDILSDVLGKSAAQIQQLLDGHAVSGRPAGL